jgi:CrcB protein
MGYEKLILGTLLAGLFALIRWGLMTSVGGGTYAHKLEVFTGNLGVFLANVLGCFLLGVLFSLSEKGIVSSSNFVLLSVFALGALTTFSSYIFHLLGIMRTHGLVTAMLSLITINLLSLISAYAGSRIG